MYKQIVLTPATALWRWFAAKWPTWVTLAAVALLLFWVYATAGRTGQPQTGYSAGEARQYLTSLPLQSGPPEAPTSVMGGKSWYEMAETGGKRLWFDPAGGQIALEDVAAGHMWYGNPPPDALADEQSKGLIRSNLESPFFFSYLAEGKTTPSYANTAGQKAAVDWRLLERGVGVRYTMDAIGLSVYVEYLLDGDGGFEARIPQSGLLEDDANRILTLDLLPYFGAAPADADGYLLVPDGPGGLIEFRERQLQRLTPYNFPVYGYDMAVPEVADNLPRTPISFPVFGLKNAEAGWIGIIENGAVLANVKAAPAGMGTGFYQTNASFRLRSHYWRPTGLATGFKTVYQESLHMEELSVRYLFAEEGKSDYVGMANTYREYLMDNQQAKVLEGGDGPPPLLMDFVVSTPEKTPFGEEVVTVTTFEQAGQIAGRLRERGVGRLEIGLMGWERGGYPGYAPDRLPVGEGAGGEAGLRELIRELREKEVGVRVQDQPFAAADRSGTGFDPRREAIRDINGTTVKREAFNDFDGSAFSNFLVAPDIMARKHVPGLLDEWSEWQVDDVALMGIGGVLYGNYHPDRFAGRTESLRTSIAMLRDVREAIGSASTSGAFAPYIGSVDHMYEFPLTYNYDLLVDEQVPFYPIAVRGLVTYSSAYGNQRDDPTVDFLRDLEYGALPSYLVTHGDPRLLKRTLFSELYSSQFEVLEEKILEEYDAYAEVLDDVWLRPILNHRKLAEGVYETEYEGGRRVVVNYNNEPFAQGEYRVEGLAYQVLKGGERHEG